LALVTGEKETTRDTFQTQNHIKTQVHERESNVTRYPSINTSREGQMEGTMGRMMMIKRLGRSNGVMANDKEVKNFHLNAKCGDE
jgi:hypothetical protein